MMREAVEQTAVYGALLVMLAILVLFGIGAAEKGVNSLVVGASDAPVTQTAQQVPPAKDKAVAQGKTQAKTEQAAVKKQQLDVQGKDQRGTKRPWAEQLSRNLDSHQSVMGQVVDSMSLQMGTWLKAGSRSLLHSISDFAQKRE